MQELKIYDNIKGMENKSKKKKINLKWMIYGLGSLLLIFSVFAAVGMFRIEKVEVTGNSYYTEAEIEELVIGDHNNSLYLMFQYDYLGGKEIPFIDNVEVSLESFQHIRIRVYEKTIIGYVEYMGSNLYFDKDGTVVESSEETLEGVPCIHGLKFDTLTLYQPLEVKNEDIFDLLLSITKMTEKYELDPDAITLQKESTEIVLTFDEVRINLGTGENIDEKAARIKTLLPDLEGRSGILHMEEYTNESTNISFTKDEK